LKESQGLKAVADNNLYSYIECSAKTQENLLEVFYQAIKAVFRYRQLQQMARRKKRRLCSIL